VYFPVELLYVNFPLQLSNWLSLSMVLEAKILKPSAAYLESKCRW
jgi:hypothetical protein